jgi:hypothetical protein
MRPKVRLTGIHSTHRADAGHVELLGHREALDAERTRAADLWQDNGWMFAQPTESPPIPAPTTASLETIVARPAPDPRQHETPGTRGFRVLLSQPDVRPKGFEPLTF